MELKLHRPLKILVITAAASTALAAGYKAYRSGWQGQLWVKNANDYIQYKVLSPNRACSYGKPAQCHADEICVYTRPKYSQCVKSLAGATPFVRFPIGPEHPMACINGPMSIRHRHSFEDSLYAVDLSEETTSDSVEVHSATEGTAVVYSGCDNSPAKKKAATVKANAKTDDCGNGFGNHIRVLSPHENIITLYAHLDQVLVADGQAVRRGEVLGTVGRTGLTEKPMLHFSVHHANLQSWLEVLEFYRSHPGQVPQSIPFETQYCDPRVLPECVRKRTRVEELPCSQVREEQAVLRADWRD